MSPPTAEGLDRRQFGLSIVIGVVLWFVAAMMLRVLGPLGALDEGWRVVTYLLIVPGVVPVVLAICRLVAAKRHQVVLSVAAALLAATLCDGIALSWFPHLYGAGDAQMAASGATLLWGVGIFLAASFWLAERA